MILIVDDNVCEKIGAFKDLLERAGFISIEATTLVEAKKMIESNIDNIDAVILDYAFPESETNSTFYNQSKVPNGIVFLKKYEFKLHNKGIPLIINTSADEDEREKWLRSTSYFNKDEDVLYKCPEKEPLSTCSSVVAERIIREIISKKQERNARNAVTADKKWIPKGQTGFYNKKTYTYLRDGD